MTPGCTHQGAARIFHTPIDYCEDCVKLGQPWVHLRLCLSCGHVGCCDSSPNRHASKHFLATGHPLVRSIEPGETWVWCYHDEIVVGELES
ncbi:UBP-type zinc finger domain-containing protein [Paraburkholderia sp. SIMBA_053]|uniref:UBP-type zinc finger domain-containing protein n=1 Tax=Paraburkholderia sp. SIMBA_053 TaxID=3085794 RepID=UPI00397C8451